MTAEEHRRIEDALLAHIAKERPAFLLFSEKSVTTALACNYDDVHAVAEELRKARRIIAPTGGWKVAS